MYIEQVQYVVDAEDTDMAPDIKSLLDDYAIPSLQMAIDEACAAGATPEAADPSPDEESAGTEGAEGEESSPAEPPGDGE